MEISQLVRGARREAELSIRALADAAGVAATTITRVQSNTVDPSVGTLVRILDAAGFDLAIVAQRKGRPRRPSLSDLVDAWTQYDGPVELEWNRWRALLDHLALHADHIPEAIYTPPWPTGEPVIDALLAAVAEKLADDAALPRPSWTEHVPAPPEPYRPPMARRVDDHLVPPQLASRSLMIDGASLWRDRTTIGV